MTTQLQGLVSDGFEKVADAFRENFRDRGDTGAACTVYADGKPVVDIWTGTTGRGPWTHETRSVLFSVSKGVTTVCLLMAVDSGLIDLDDPVAIYWPEFAAHGKEAVTVRQVLAHQAGLITPEQDLTVPELAAWHPVVDALAGQAPLWKPGSAFAYHPFTFGWLAGELLRRVSGKRPSEWLREHVAEPLGLTMTFGTDQDSPDFAPIGDPLPDDDPVAAARLASTLDTPTVARSMTMGGAFAGTNLFHTANKSEFLSYEMPAANLVSNAHSLARFYAATVGNVDGIQLLKPDAVWDAREPRSVGAPFIGVNEGHRWGTGFMVDSSRREMVGPGSFGHDGAGGQLGFGHLEQQVGFGYQTIRPGGVPDERAEALCRALRACL